METFLIWFTALMGAALGFMIALMFFAGPQNLNDAVRLQAVCDYEGGVVKDDVCLKDGSVLTLDLGGNNG